MHCAYLDVRREEEPPACLKELALPKPQVSQLTPSLTRFIWQDVDPKAIKCTEDTHQIGLTLYQVP
jgi:hypothetical protein